MDIVPTHSNSAHINMNLTSEEKSMNLTGNSLTFLCQRKILTTLTSGFCASEYCKILLHGKVLLSHKMSWAKICFQLWIFPLPIGRTVYKPMRLSPAQICMCQPVDWLFLRRGFCPRER